MHESVKVDDVLKKITVSPTDSRVVDLINEKRIESGTLANLLHKFIQVKHPDQFQFRYVGKGKSKCVVLLLAQGHPEDSLVIKCGEKELIEEEFRKFDRSAVGDDQALARGIGDWFRPPLRGHPQQYLDYYAIAFEFPSGCKSVQTLRDALSSDQFSRDELIKGFKTFSLAFVKWQKLAAGIQMPLGSFHWHERDRARVPEAIAAYKSRHPDRVVENLNSVLDGNHPLWWDKLQKIDCTYGVSHGDLNSHNLLHWSIKKCRIIIGRLLADDTLKIEVNARYSGAPRSKNSAVEEGKRLVARGICGQMRCWTRAYEPY